MVKYVMTELSKLFGGATASKSVGGWMSQTHGLILEDVTIVYAYCTSGQAANHFEDVFAICEKIKHDMKQEAVTLEYNGQVKFVWIELSVQYRLTGNRVGIVLRALNYFNQLN